MYNAMHLIGELKMSIHRWDNSRQLAPPKFAWQNGHLYGRDIVSGQRGHNVKIWIFVTNIIVLILEYTPAKVDVSQNFR